MSDKPRLVYSTDKAHIIRLARASGLTDVEILTRLVAGVFGKAARRKIISEWAPFLDLTETEAFDLARGAALI